MLLFLVSPGRSQRGTASAAAATAKPALQLLVVGIDKNEDSKWNLDYARKDAEAIARFFQQPDAKKLFGAVRTIRLMDRDATKDAIGQALCGLKDQGQPDDVALIYLAGHGVAVGQQFYFVAILSNARRGDE